MEDTEGSEGRKLWFAEEGVHKVAFANIEIDRFQFLEGMWAEGEVIEMEVLSAVIIGRTVGGTAWSVYLDRLQVLAKAHVDGIHPSRDAG